MPSSTWVATSTVCDLIYKYQPKTMLDIGVGFGRWGIVCRELMDIFKGRYHKSTWKTIINGVEIFPDYIYDYHHYFYNQIFINDALDFLQKHSQSYDLVICGDVLEHFEKPQGYELINLCKQKSKHAIFGVPIGPNYPQGKTLGNVHETHLAVWEEQDFVSTNPIRTTIFKERVKNRPYAIILYEGLIK